MSSNDHTQFRDAQHYGKPEYTDNLEVGLKHYFDWALLQIGAWQQIDASSSGIYGGGFEELHDVHPKGLSSRRVYQSIRKEWIYETGVDYESVPLNISSIVYNSGSNVAQITLAEHEKAYFNSGDTLVITNNSSNFVNTGDHTLYSGNTSTLLLNNPYVSFVTVSGEIVTVSGVSVTYPQGSSYSGLPSVGGTIQGVYNPVLPTIYVDGVENTDCTINYPLGQVTFDSQLPMGSDVTATYSFRNVQTYVSDHLPWMYQLQYDTLNPNHLQWTQNIDSGNFSMNSKKRVQLPAILIETVGNGTSSPFHLGSLTARLKQDVLCTVVSQNKWEKNNLVDILRKLQDKTIWLYDQYEVHKRNFNSLNGDGSVNTSGLVYKDIVNTDVLRWRKAYFDKVNVSSVETKSPDLHMSKIRFSIEIID